MLSEPGRKALLRREVVSAGVSPGACDRALRALRTRGEITRFGHGVYGAEGVKLFTALEEILKRLDIQRLPDAPVKGYSQYLGGNVVRVARPVNRRLRFRGVQIYFENSDGKTFRRRPQVRTQIDQMPSSREIEEHYHSFERCHSLARAEKDLLVGKALSFMEDFDGGDCLLALEGGTSLAYYYSSIQRFSEDLDIRFIAPEEAPPRKSPERIALFKQFGNRFSNAVEACLPWLQRSKKGRFRPDGSVQPLIFDYTSRVPHKDVVQGIKFELVDVRRYLPLRRIVRRNRVVPAIDQAEIAAGKWQALVSWMPSNPSNRTLVRHAGDLAQISPGMGSLQGEWIGRIVESSGGITPERVIAALSVLFDGSTWERYYLDYMERMGTRQVSMFGGDHLPWDHVRGRLSMAAIDAGLADVGELEQRGWVDRGFDQATGLPG